MFACNVGILFVALGCNISPATYSRGIQPIESSYESPLVAIFYLSWISSGCESYYLYSIPTFGISVASASLDSCGVMSELHPGGETCRYPLLTQGAPIIWAVFRTLHFLWRQVWQDHWQLPGCWFGTWLLFSISYLGCHPSHWRTHIFQRDWNHQAVIFFWISSGWMS